jgi:hypothetical protein
MFLPVLPYYQAMALRKLGEETAARHKLQEFLDHASKEAESGFATSQPNFLPFEDDPRKVKRIEYAYLIGPARLGLGQVSEAKRAFEEVLALDINHLGAQRESRRLSAISQ